LEVNVLFTQLRTANKVVQFYPEVSDSEELLKTSAEAEQMAGWFHGLLNEVGFGILILNSNLEVYFCNEIAKIALEDAGLLRIFKSRHLISEVPESLMGQPSQHFYSQAKLALQGDRKFVIIGEGVKQTMVALSPINLGAPNFKQGLLVTTERQSVCKNGSLWAYGKALGLTSGELRVLSFLANGQEPKIVAKSLDVSVTTVRSHIRSIIGKTSSTNLRDVLLKISKLPPMSDVSFA
jgi:DNA-binding CsgD family transcriptional regulator